MKEEYRITFIKRLNAQDGTTYDTNVIRTEATLEAGLRHYQYYVNWSERTPGVFIDLKLTKRIYQDEEIASQAAL